MLLTLSHSIHVFTMCTTEQLTRLKERNAGLGLRSNASKPSPHLILLLALECHLDDLNVVIVRVSDCQRLPGLIKERISNAGVNEAPVNRLRFEDFLVARPRSFRGWGSSKANSAVFNRSEKHELKRSEDV